MRHKRQRSSKTPDPSLLARLAKLGVRRGLPAEKHGGRASRRPTAALSIETVVPGSWVESVSGGRCYVSTVHRAAQDRHGDRRLETALTTSTASLARLARDERIRGLDPERTGFIDTETTGLATGPGTYAFLIGIGRFRGQTFQVRQFFMDDPSQERAQLDAATAWLEGCTGLVSFNGRAFDLPLLVVRYGMHGLRMPLAEAPHLDLLPAARRIWRRRLPSCSLGSLEQSVLGITRADDVPGALIPPRYFNYQRQRDARPLAPVFQHNVTDILSMVTLMSILAESYLDPRGVVAHATDWLSLGRAYAADGDNERAVAACEAALTLAGGLTAADEAEAHRCLSYAAKRLGNWERALAAWKSLADEARRGRVYPYEEIAKYYEHRAPERDYERALNWAMRARELVASGTLRPHRGKARTMQELDHRIARLQRKAAAELERKAEGEP